MKIVFMLLNIEFYIIFLLIIRNRKVFYLFIVFLMIFVIRHGERADEFPDLYHLIKNDIDPPLTPMGHT